MRPRYAPKKKLAPRKKPAPEPPPPVVHKPHALLVPATPAGGAVTLSDLTQAALAYAAAVGYTKPA